MSRFLFFQNPRAGYSNNPHRAGIDYAVADTTQETCSVSISPAAGSVAIVGAGPGDLGLLTVRGAALLADADLIAYDALMNVAMLDQATRAEKIYVGKRANDHSMTQDQINALLIEHARAGKRVVRLKGGDPLIYGRGGEEALALRQAGIAFEIVPGVTTALAAAAYVGVPLTHRGVATSLGIYSGHDLDAIDWSAAARIDTLAIYMGVGRLEAIAERLVRAGRTSTTPAAIVQHATLPHQRSVFATLESIHTRAEQAGIGTPAVVLIGQSVSLHESLNWFEDRPLFGKTILVTRSRAQISDLSIRLTALGANVIEAPTIEITEPASWEPLDQALRSLRDSPAMVVFTSVNGVTHTARRLIEIGLDARRFAGCQLAAVGAATAAAMRQHLGLRADVVSKFGTTDSLVDDFAALQLPPQRFLLLRSDIARPTLRVWLAAQNHQVDDVAVYDTRKPAALPANAAKLLEEKKIDWITFTSSSTARFLAELIGPGFVQKLGRSRLASIGPITSTEIRSLGLRVDAEASPPGIGELVDAILRAGS